MERKVKFAEGEHYHLFSRGVEKRKIFQSRSDYNRFITLLYILNQPQPFHTKNFLITKGHSLYDVFDEERNFTLVSILSYCLMPNHFHLLVYEKEEGGITKFMGKILTAYAMYFNKKNDRSGPLFVHPFRSVHINKDPHFLHLFSYIHLNPLELVDGMWKEKGFKSRKQAKKFLDNYMYSSYPDYRGVVRKESKILDMNNVPESISRTVLDIEAYEDWYKNYQG
jgi:putative transposase